MKFDPLSVGTKDRVSDSDLFLMEAAVTACKGIGVIRVDGKVYAHLEQVTCGEIERILIPIGSDVLYGRKYDETMATARSEHLRHCVSIRGLDLDTPVAAIKTSEPSIIEPPELPFVTDKTVREEMAAEHVSFIDGVASRPEPLGFQMPQIKIDDYEVEPIAGYVGNLQTDRPGWQPDDARSSEASHE